ncbi:c-type heme family protein [Tolypothrix sp. VBCCA 56010]|uniref:c-type heme family protein n=1 Tax=Tolypothrix sp. VBCCA 56010 TaxID=3137731 RepID=UPI003D7D006F
MLKNLNLKQQFTALLIIILALGLSLSGFTLSYVLKQNAMHDITSTALMLMETMTSVREYTNTQVQPLLENQLETEFLPQTVPAYSAREIFDHLRTNLKYRDFFYKEATLNPTNLRDKADNFETTIINNFQKKPDLKQSSGFRSMPSGDIFYMARPLIITQESCLKCHTSPDIAPKSMIERYGTANGFGWHINEIIGSQIISIPAGKVISKANQSSFLILVIVSTVFIAVIFLVNLFLNQKVVRPLKRITRVAEEVSTGHMDVEFEQFSNDEIGQLARAFRRMQLSLEMAMKRIKRRSETTSN